MYVSGNSVRGACMLTVTMDSGAVCEEYGSSWLCYGLWLLLDWRHNIRELPNYAETTKCQYSLASRLYRPNY